MVSGLPGLAALIALVFASLSVKATNDQLQIAQQGQVTDRYNAAITNLASSSTDIRLGGIYALQRLMQDSSRDQPTVIAVLCAFIRDHAPTTKAAHPTASPAPPSADIQAALTVIGTRNTANDGSTTLIDLSNTQLTGAYLSGNLTTINGSADFAGAKLIDASITAKVNGADFTGANLTDASLSGENLTGASFYHADLHGANLSGASLAGADLTFANLTGANVSASLTGANLQGADLTGAYLFAANLTDANLTAANLTDANLTDANFHGAVLKGARGIPPGTLSS